MATARQIALPRWLILAAVLLTGCMYDRHDEIPPDAMMTSSGNGDLSYTPDRHGMIYVYDANDNRMIYAGEIERDQAIMVDPDKNHVTVNGRTVFEKGLDRGHNVKIFFKPMPTSERVIIEEHRETTR